MQLALHLGLSYDRHSPSLSCGAGYATVSLGRPGQVSPGLCMCAVCEGLTCAGHKYIYVLWVDLGRSPLEPLGDQSDPCATTTQS